MAFLDILLPTNIRITSSGGPEFHTEIAATPGGKERRNIIRDQSIHKFSVDYVQSAEGLKALKAFFQVVRGSAYSFRYKDWTDFTADATEGNGRAEGYPWVQLTKRYTATPFFYDRDITKPVQSAFVGPSRNGIAMVQGAAAGNYSSIDFTKGRINMVPDVQRAISAHIVGSSHQFQTALSIGLNIGDYVYVHSATGSVLFNGIAFKILNISGAGPVTYTIELNSTGGTLTGGIAEAYPQADDDFGWSGEFHVPCRFDTDRFRADGVSGTNIYGISGLTLTEDLLAGLE